MILDTLKILFARDLNKLKTEIEQFNDETDLWKINGQIKNSAGNLCLHLVGNLNTYIGKELGNSGYVRNRDLEFSAKNVPRDELIQKIENTVLIVDTTLTNLDPNILNTEFPVLVFEKTTSVEYMLVHLATHLAYHLGQVNYHRRLLETSNPTQCPLF